MTESIDIFNIHKKIMDNYKHFVRSFVNIKNEKIKNFVESEINEGKFWPEPLIQFNPSFEPGESIQSLIGENILHPELVSVFKGYDLFKHQSEALVKGSEGSDFVVTSGTGSGKSLTFIGTIFNYLLNNKTSEGVKAVIVYPMNALINSQTEEFDRYKEIYEKETGKQKYTKEAQPKLNTLIQFVSQKAIDAYNETKDYKTATENFYLTYKSRYIY